MDNISITFQTLLQAFGAIAIIGGGLKYIMDWLKPHRELGERLKKVEARQGNDNKRLNKIEETLNAQSILLIEISNHLITGNDKDALKEKSDALFQTIMKKGE